MKKTNKILLTALLIPTIVGSLGLSMMIDTKLVKNKKVNTKAESSDKYFTINGPTRISLQNKIKPTQLTYLLGDELITANKTGVNATYTPILNQIGLNILPTINVDPNYKIGIKELRVKDFQKWSEIGLKFGVYTGYTANTPNYIASSSVEVVLTDIIPFKGKVRLGRMCPGYIQSIEVSNLVQDNYVNNVRGPKPVREEEINQMLYKQYDYFTHGSGDTRNFLYETKVTEMEKVKNTISFKYDVIGFFEIPREDTWFGYMGLYHIKLDTPVQPVPGIPRSTLVFDVKWIPPEMDPVPPPEPPVEPDNSQPSKPEAPDKPSTNPDLDPEPAPLPPSNPDDTPKPNPGEGENPFPSEGEGGGEGPKPNDQTQPPVFGPDDGPSVDNTFSTGDVMSSGFVMTLVTACIMLLMIMLFVCVMSTPFGGKKRR